MLVDRTQPHLIVSRVLWFDLDPRTEVTIIGFPFRVGVLEDDTLLLRDHDNSLVSDATRQAQHAAELRRRCLSQSLLLDK